MSGEIVFLGDQTPVSHHKSLPIKLPDNDRSKCRMSHVKFCQVTRARYNANGQLMACCKEEYEKAWHSLLPDHQQRLIRFPLNDQDRERCLADFKQQLSEMPIIKIPETGPNEIEKSAQKNDSISLKNRVLPVFAVSILLFVLRKRLAK